MSAIWADSDSSTGTDVRVVGDDVDDTARHIGRIDESKQLREVR